MGKILLWFQERIKLWIKPVTSVLIIDLLSDLTRSHTNLVVENALLCQQLIVLNRQIKRPQLTNPDRFLLVLLSRFTKFWKQALHIVQPDILLRWHRELFGMYWWKRSQGEPKISDATIALIEKMAKENQLWGAERIQREEIALFNPNLGDLPEESSEWHLGMRLYGSNRLVVPAMVCICRDGVENATNSIYRSNKIPNG